MNHSARPGRRRIAIVAVAALAAVAGCSSGSEPDAATPGSGTEVSPQGSDDLFGAGTSESSGSPDTGSGASDSDVSGVDDGDRDESGSDASDFTEVDASDDAAPDGEIEQVPPDEVETVGTPPPTFVYTEEVEPAATVAATLCNLTSTFIGSLRSEDEMGAPVVDDDLRLSLLALGDSVSFWRGLTISFPETEDDVQTAIEIERLWTEALSAEADGDVETARALMVEADEAIDSLPEVGPDDVDACIS